MVARSAGTWPRRPPGPMISDVVRSATRTRSHRTGGRACRVRAHAVPAMVIGRTDGVRRGPVVACALGPAFSGSGQGGRRAA